jgi:hypothetical protein
MKRATFRTRGYCPILARDVDAKLVIVALADCGQMPGLFVLYFLCKAFDGIAVRLATLRADYL